MSVEDDVSDDADEYEDVYTYDGDTKRCEDCGGEMKWCTSCNMYSKTCCDDYGTCACS